MRDLFNDKELQFIDSYRDSQDYSKIRIKKLYSYYKKATGIREHNCFCEMEQRIEFKQYFYIWFDNVTWGSI